MAATLFPIFPLLYHKEINLSMLFLDDIAKCCSFLHKIPGFVPIRHVKFHLCKNERYISLFAVLLWNNSILMISARSFILLILLFCDKISAENAKALSADCEQSGKLQGGLPADKSNDDFSLIEFIVDIGIRFLFIIYLIIKFTHLII